MFKRFSDMLRGLFSGPSPSTPETTAHRAARLEKKILALVENLPTLPDAANRAVALADDPNCRMSDLARLIEADAAIATGLLRVANSALFAAGNPVTKLDQALSRLGLWSAKNLIISIAVQSLFRGIKGDAKARCEALWRHGSTTADLARHLNHTFRLGFKGEEYSAGLLHDLGRVLIAVADPESFSLADPMTFREDTDPTEGERAVLGVDHAALGSLFATHTNLPNDLVQAIRHHHGPDRAESAHRLVALTATADHLANHIHRGESAVAYDPKANGGLSCLWAGWPQTRKDRFLADVPTLLKGISNSAEAA